MNATGIDNRALLKRLNKAAGIPANAEVEDLSHPIIQIYGAEGCREVEAEQTVNEFGFTGIPRLLSMLLDNRTLPDVRETICAYFAEYDTHKVRMLRGHVKTFQRRLKHPEAQKILAELLLVMEE